MRILMFGLVLVTISGCGSKSSEADTGGPVFSEGVDDDGSTNADSDADGGTDADGGPDADLGRTEDSPPAHRHGDGGR